MARTNVIPLRPRTPRYSAAIAAESFMEVQAQLHEVRDFVDAELRTSWQRGHDTERMRHLQRADAAIRAIDAEAKRAAAWADAACADGLARPGHGAAA
jgi:hypothetical protein